MLLYNPTRSRQLSLSFVFNSLSVAENICAMDQILDIDKLWELGKAKDSVLSIADNYNVIILNDFNVTIGDSHERIN